MNAPATRPRTCHRRWRPAPLLSAVARTCRHDGKRRGGESPPITRRSPANPDYAEAHNNLANLLRDAGRHRRRQRAALYETAIRSVRARLCPGALSILPVSAIMQAEQLDAKAREPPMANVQSPSKPDWAEPQYNLAIDRQDRAGNHLEQPLRQAFAAAVDARSRAQPRLEQSWPGAAPRRADTARRLAPMRAPWRPIRSNPRAAL